MSNFSHFNKEGEAIMVDVSHKEATHRTATAVGHIKVSPQVMEGIINQDNKKGDVLGIARTAGIMATKNTSQLIPLCHPLMISKVEIDFQLDDKSNIIHTSCTVKVEGKTGVEMEALTGVTVSLLTIYDMCKAVDKKMIISDVHLMEKTGGKSGHFLFDD